VVYTDKDRFTSLVRYKHCFYLGTTRTMIILDVHNSRRYARSLLVGNK
jgi:hypothetical protein